MHKKKIIKSVLILLFIVIAGTFYSCKSDYKSNVSLITNPEENVTTVNNNDTTREVNSLVDNKDRDGDVNSTSDNKNTASEEVSGVDSIEAVDTWNSTADKLDSTGVNGSPVQDDTAEGLEHLDSFAYIYVHICGEVKNPDVYKVERNTRVYEVIAKAGGLTASAADSYINQAAMVTDGQQIYIPSLEEVKDTLPANSSKIPDSEVTQNSSNHDDVVNINEALAEELMTLSGIGEAKAQAIIEYRKNNGGFKAIEEIKNIDGIKDAVYNKIKDKITVR